jgi:phosphatidate cytidylyltransferase
MRTFLIRSASALVFGILVLGSLLLNAWLFSSVMLMFAVLGMWEFFSITRFNEVSANKASGLFAGIFLYISIAFMAHANHQGWMLFLNFIPLAVIFISELFSKSSNPFIRISLTLLGVLYVSLPLSLLNFFYYPTLGNIPQPGVLLSFFLLIWINDTFAYITGMLTGKHLLFERISPKKTWEGSVGGLFFTIGAAYLISRYLDVLTLYQWMGFAIIAVIFGTLGDLIESMLKRSLNIKDSGNIMPGHGGILDRFDAALFASPVVFAYLYLMYFYF